MQNNYTLQSNHNFSANSLPEARNPHLQHPLGYHSGADLISPCELDIKNACNSTPSLRWTIKRSFPLRTGLVLLIAILLSGVNINAQSTLIHFWYFDDNIPNNTPLEEVDAFYSIIGAQATLEFQSALAGYPFDSLHPNWRKASMERRNHPTPINYRPIANAGMSYDATLMRGLQVKQPFSGEGGENTLILHLPSSGYKDIVFSMVVADEGAADALVVDYSVNEGTPQWSDAGLISNTFELTTDYRLISIDFSENAVNVPQADDNAHFKIRIRFQGTDMQTDLGHRVTFNNVSLDGTPLEGTNPPPVIITPLSFEKLIEGGSALTINLDQIFSNPDGDLLTYTAESNRSNFAQAVINGSTLEVVPHRRGDATLTVTADDGHNPGVSTSFRVLIYPQAHSMGEGPFSFTEWNNNQPELSYPEHMIFLQTDHSDPDANAQLDFAYFIPHNDYHADDQGTIGFPYNNSGRSRINGLGSGGISFINTGRDRDLGGALLAINTTGQQNLKISFLAATMLRNERLYALRLQYRTDIHAEFQNLMLNNELVEYLASTDGHVHIFDNIELPEQIMDQDYVQLLWRYHFIGGDTGPRALLRLDDISLDISTRAEQETIPATRVFAAGKNIIITNITSEPYDLKIYDSTGRLMLSRSSVQEKHFTLNTSLPTGVYIARIISENFTQSSKVFIQ